MESGLSYTFDEICERIAFERGFSPDEEDRSDDENRLIRSIIKDGASKFYLQSSYQWSFLRPVKEFTLPSGKDRMLLPPDFGQLVGRIFFKDGSISGSCVKYVSDTEVLKLQQTSSGSTGKPSKAAIVPAQQGSGGHRQEMLFWPEADDDYIVRCRYSVLPEALTENRPYPLGGAAHSKTFLEACLAASEEINGVPGLHVLLYRESLAASIEYDRKTKPPIIGREADEDMNYWPETSIITYVPS